MIHKAILFGLTTVMVWVSSAPFAQADTGITGRVTGQSVEGKYVGMVPGATIEILRPGGEVAATSTADARGLFKIELPPGQYYYRVKAEGYQDEDTGRGFQIERTDAMESFEFALTQGQNRPDRVPAVIPESTHGTLIGRVVAEVDGEVHGVSRAKVTLVNDSTRQVEEVNAKPRGGVGGRDVGVFQISLPAGTWRGSVRATGYALHVAPEPIVIEVDENTARTFKLHRFEPPAEMLAMQGIRGEVLIEKAGRTFTPPFTVTLNTLRPSDRQIIDTQTIAISESEFSINVPPGTYQVVASAADSEFRKAVSAPVHVFPGRFSRVRLVMRHPPLDQEIVDLEVIEPAEGIMPPPDEETELGPQPEPPDLEIVAIDRQGKKPLVEVEVLLREVADQKATVIRGRTGTDGIARFRIPEGKYFVIARLAGFEIVAATPSDRFSRGRLLLPVHSGQSNRATFILDRHREPDAQYTDREFTASGAVMYQAETGLGTALIPGAQVTWRGPNTVSATTDSLGRYSVGVMHGTYRVTVVPPVGGGYTTRTFRDIFVNDDLTRNFTLRREADMPTIGPSVQVNVRDERTRRPISGASVRLQRAGAGGVATSGSTTNTGQVTMNLREPGRYLAQVSASGYTPMRRELSATPGQIAVVNFALRRSIGPIIPDDTGPILPDERRSGGPEMMTVSGWVVTPRTPAKPPSLAGRLTPRTLRRAGEPDWTRMQPVAGADVIWYWPGTTTGEGGAVLPGAVRLARTDSRGQFRIANVFEDAYRVVVRAAGYSNLDTQIGVRSGMSGPVLVLNRKGGSVVPPDQPLLKQQLLTVEVMDQRRRIGISGATVTIVRDGKSVRTGTTDPKGYYRTQVSPGIYQIKASGQSITPGGTQANVTNRNVTARIMVQRTSGGTTPGTVTPGTTTPGAVKPSLSRQSLTVRVVDRKRQGVSGATVSVLQGNTTVRTGRTDGGGFYRTSLPNGSYFLKASGTMVNPGGSQVQVQNRAASATINVTRTQSSSGPSQIVPGTTNIRYIAQYRRPGSNTWSTIGTYDTRRTAELAARSAKLPPKSKSRVVPQSVPLNRLPTARQ